METIRKVIQVLRTGLVGYLSRARPAWVSWFSAAASITFSTSSHADGTGAPLNYFTHAAGPAAAPTMRLGWMMTALSVGVS
ncbi:MAG: hypothetical protein ABSD12_24490, partial [Paraburkholderia sp.]